MFIVGCVLLQLLVVAISPLSRVEGVEITISSKVKVAIQPSLKSFAVRTCPNNSILPQIVLQGKLLCSNILYLSNVKRVC